MRLIDADLLAEEIESFRCTLTGLRNGKGLLARAADEYRKSILQVIEDQPTAFDKEKMIEEIKGIMDDESIRFVNQAVNRTIEIVEKGGIE